MTRYATFRADTVRQAEAYMPDNYRVTHIVTLPDGKVNVVIEGEDVAGWTLDGYVIPRLGSGLMHVREHDSYADTVEAAAASIN